MKACTPYRYDALKISESSLMLASARFPLKVPGKGRGPPRPRDTPAGGTDKPETKEREERMTEDETGSPPEPGSEGWWEGSETILNLPRSHWHCQLTGFAWDTVGPSATREKVREFLTEVEAGGSPHLILTGRPGIGKSHLGVGIYRWAARRYGTRLTYWMEVPDFYDRVKAGFDSGADPFADLEEARRLIVLDDLFGRDASEYESSRLLYRLINHAYRIDAALVVTMNQPITDLQSRLPGHEVSRLLANAVVLQMNAEKDYRRSRP